MVILKFENLAHPNSSSTHIISVQKRFLLLPPSLSSVPLPSSLHNMDLENAHIGIFPRIQYKFCGSQLFLDLATHVQQFFCTRSRLIEYIPIPLKTAFAQHPGQTAIIKCCSDATCSLFLHSCKLATDYFVPMSSNC